ncbi:Reticulon-domain-containing protein [Pilobolus umbonatus]|nr:Reticulon-domain-containing protein [Pilobolus umbonatus]
MSPQRASDILDRNTTPHASTFQHQPSTIQPSTTHTSYPTRPDTKRYKSSQRNETTSRIESEVLSILQWDNPARSGVMLCLTVGSILMTRWYSLLQLGCAFLTIAIAINLVYVNLMTQSQKVLTNQEGSHPYRDVIQKEKPNDYINRDSINRMTSIFIDISETVVRALTRIVFVENTITSVKWMSIFFVIWKISARVPTMDILLSLIISAFIFPRLYISNKEVVDAQIHKGQSLIQEGINKAQNVATEGVHETYDKARNFVAHVGTSETDAKNTLRHTSVTAKEE